MSTSAHGVSERTSHRNNSLCSQSTQSRIFPNVCIFCRYTSRPVLRCQAKAFRSSLVPRQSTDSGAERLSYDSHGSGVFSARSTQKEDGIKAPDAPKIKDYRRTIDETDPRAERQGSPSPDSYEGQAMLRNDVKQPIRHRFRKREGRPPPPRGRMLQELGQRTHAPTDGMKSRDQYRMTSVQTRCPSCAWTIHINQVECPRCNRRIPKDNGNQASYSQPPEPVRQAQQPSPTAVAKAKSIAEAPEPVRQAQQPSPTPVAEAKSIAEAPEQARQAQQPSPTPVAEAKSIAEAPEQDRPPQKRPWSRTPADLEAKIGSFLRDREDFTPDPRIHIPKLIELGDAAKYWTRDRITHQQRVEKFLNNISGHLQKGYAWVCKSCTARNQGRFCSKCSGPIYPVKINRELRMKRRCHQCKTETSLLNDRSCPGCGKSNHWQPYIQDLRQQVVYWTKRPVETLSNANTTSHTENVQDDPRAGESVSGISASPNDVQPSQQVSSAAQPPPPLHVTKDIPTEVASDPKHPSPDQWASYQPTSKPSEDPLIRRIEPDFIVRRPMSGLPDKYSRQLNKGPNSVIRQKVSDLPERSPKRSNDLPHTSKDEENDEQPFSADDMERMTRRPKQTEPLVRFIGGPEAEQSTEGLEQSIEGPEQSTEAQVPSRMDRRREALAQGMAKGKPDRRRGFRNARSEDLLSYDDEADSERRGRKRAKAVNKPQRVTEAPTPIYLPDFITVNNLATALDINIGKFTDVMRSLGFEDTNNDLVLDAETAGLIAAEFNFEAIVDTQESEQDLKAVEEANEKSDLPARPPVVTIMGHVDHGKTTILDYLRKSSVAASEHGGITQHIGAFSVSMPSGRLITFLDTPGHKAFLDMRQRGANVTDIVILVVAADDSVKPQTVEAIKHAKGAGVQMIVAINKIDKEDADLDRVKGDLARNGVIIEEFGGDIQVVNVSGKTGEGMELLEEATIALADTLELRAPTNGTVEGWILEATTTKAGRVATILVRRGTLTSGQTIVAGSTWTKVRTLRNEAGVEISSAGPGTPVEVDGWRDQPAAGDEVLQANDESHARDVIDHRVEVSERKQMSEDVSAINEARRLEQEKREREDADARRYHGTLAPDEVANPNGPKEIPLLIKADVSGSAEAVMTSLPSLGNSEVRPLLLRSGVGPVAESDVEHAATAKGHIVAFNTSTEGAVRRLAEQKGVSIIEQTIIYKLMEEINGKLSEYLKPVVTTKVLGEAEVAQLFEITIKGRKTNSVAGCKIRNGIVNRNSKVRVLREGETVYDGMFSPSDSFRLLRSSTFGHQKHADITGQRYVELPQKP